MADYLNDYKRRGGKGLYITETTINAHIIPAFGDMQVSKLTRKRIEDWHTALSNKPPRLRSKPGTEQQYRDLPQDEDSVRRRRSTANRVLTIFKAALNNAYQRGHVTNQNAWDAVKPFREVDAAKIRYLTDKEAVRLINVCGGELRGLVTAALLTGARYGELTSLKVTDYNTDSGTINIGRSKSGKSRHIVLTDEGKAFFKQASTGKTGKDLFFLKASGSAWQHADQFRQMKEACSKAKITPSRRQHEEFYTAMTEKITGSRSTFDIGGFLKERKDAEDLSDRVSGYKEGNDKGDETTALSAPCNLVVATSAVEPAIDGIYANGRYRARTRGSPLVRYEIPSALEPFLYRSPSQPSVRLLETFVTLNGP